VIFLIKEEHMKTWLTSLNGAISLMLIALLASLGRTFADFQYVFNEFFPRPDQAVLAILILLALFGGWFLGLLVAARGGRGGLIAAFVFNLLFLFGFSIGTLVAYCPSPCPTAWPLMEIINWVNLGTGLIAAVAAGLHLWPKARVVA
jgi:hypothetical protein